MRLAVAFPLALWLPLVLPPPGRAADVPADRPDRPGVATLLEDNAAALLPLLTNPTGDPGEGRVEEAVVFSGMTGVKIIPMQRFHPHIPGWQYRIAENPGPGEYRYVRFAWRADECRGIMLQLHDEKDWSLRYVAGVDVPAWGSKSVADRPPAEWAVVTRDLFKDFGPRVIQGMALTAFDGRAGYFDHIYFGRTVEDLDRVDTTGLRSGPPVRLTSADLDRLWLDLTDDDASRSYLAFWTLVADPNRSAPFLRRKLVTAPPEALAAQVRRWVADLADGRPGVREAATEHLARHLNAAAGPLADVLAADPPPEVRARAAALSARHAARGGAPDPDPTADAVRALAYGGTAEAKKYLDELAAGAEGERVA